MFSRAQKHHLADEKLKKRGEESFFVREKADGEETGANRLFERSCLPVGVSESERVRGREGGREGERCRWRD